MPLIPINGSSGIGLYLPLFGASLIAVKVLEMVVLRRIPGVCDWLGLKAPCTSAVTTEA
jgi:hypothetical protein